MTGREELIYESIIRDMSEGVMVINLDGAVESINPAAETILGKKKDEVAGQQYARIFVRDIENDVFNQAVLDALYDPTARHEKIVPWHNDGQTKQLYMVTSFLFHEELPVVEKAKIPVFHLTGILGLFYHKYVSLSRNSCFFYI